MVALLLLSYRRIVIIEAEEKAGCFAIVVLQIFCNYNVMWLFLTMQWIGLKYLIVVFTDQTHFKSEKQLQPWGLRYILLSKSSAWFL